VLAKPVAVRVIHPNRPGPQQSAYRLLAEDAEAFIPVAAANPSVDVEALCRAQDRRRIALLAVVPKPRPGVFRRIGGGSCRVLGGGSWFLIVGCRIWCRLVC